MSTAEFIHANGFNAKVIRTNRIKTATIKVEQSEVSVVVPFRLSQARIEELLKKKNRWVKQKIKLQNQHQPFKTKEYVSGECFQYLGKNYRLKVYSRKKASAKLLNGELVVCMPKQEQNRQAKIKAEVEAWYLEHAFSKLEEKITRYSKLVGKSPTKLTVKSFKSRWGSCTLSGHVQINWKIIMAPTRVIDYVVVHELCHLIHHDHSKEFWKEVDRVMPDYKESREWLKHSGKCLEL